MRNFKMVVRRIKNDELYHHGIKGQRWGVRHYQNPDGSLTNAGRQRYSTGKSKGVHRRGEGLGFNGISPDKLTGPVGRKDAYIGKLLDGRFTNDYKDYLKSQQINDISFGFDHNLKSNRITYKKVDTKDGGNYTIQFKDKQSHDTWLKTMQLDDESITNFLINEMKAGASQEEAVNDVATYMSSRLTTNIKLLEKKGYMDYDVNSEDYNPNYPFTAYTNFDSTVGQLMPATELYPEVFEDAGVDLGINSRRKQYLQDARDTMRNVKKMIAHNKKLSTKVKRFIQSVKEVNQERVEKGKAFLKKLFNKK